MDASTATGLPAASLIICSRNRPQLLSESVEAVLQGDEVPTELIIIDQSDSPHPRLAALTTDRACEIRYLWTRSIGLSRANNAGVTAARHHILVFTHDDVLAPPAWFGAIVRALVQAGPRAVVTGRVLPTATETPGGFAPSTRIDELRAVYEGRIGNDVLYPMNMALYRSAINDVGSFDERLGPGTPYPAAEDNDFGFRLLEAGYRIIYAPEVVLHHRAWRGEDDYIPLRWSYGRGQGAYYAKYLSLGDRYMLRRMRRDIGRHVLKFTHRVRRERRLAFGDAAYILGILSGATQWLMTQRRMR